MQAQDLASAEWSFGARSAGLTQSDVHRATLDKQILRTWSMRGTVHFVPPRDARWMLELTGVRALKGAQRRREHLGLTESTVVRATEVLAEALRGGGRLTRARCVQVMLDAGIETAPEHGYHLLWYASQVGVTCIGPQEGREQTFVLLDEWVPDPHRPDRDEALATLALRFFRGRGPATRADFIGWTGLTATDARHGIDLAENQLSAVAVDGEAMWASTEVLETAAGKSDQPGILMLSGFDEFMLGYKDRSLSIALDRMKRVIPGGNGVFRSTVVDRGRVIGTWTRKLRRRHVDIFVDAFSDLSSEQTAGIRDAAERYGTYLGLEPVLDGLD